VIQGPPRLLAELPALEPEPRLGVFGLDSSFLFIVPMTLCLLFCLVFMTFWVLVFMTFVLVFMTFGIFSLDDFLSWSS